MSGYKQKPEGKNQKSPIIKREETCEEPWGNDLSKEKEGKKLGHAKKVNEGTGTRGWEEKPGVRQLRRIVGHHTTGKMGGEGKELSGFQVGERSGIGRKIAKNTMGKPNGVTCYGDKKFLWIQRGDRATTHPWCLK